MTCTVCGKDYVGQTKDLRKRMNKHIYFCRLEKYQCFKDPYLHVIPFLLVENDKLHESKESSIQHLTKKIPCSLSNNISECLDTQKTRLRSRAKNIEHVKSVKYIRHISCALNVNRSENRIVLQKSEGILETLTELMAFVESKETKQFTGKS